MPGTRAWMAGEGRCEAEGARGMSASKDCQGRGRGHGVTGVENGGRLQQADLQFPRRSWLGWDVLRNGERRGLGHPVRGVSREGAREATAMLWYPRNRGESGKTLIRNSDPICGTENASSELERPTMGGAYWELRMVGHSGRRQPEATDRDKRAEAGGTEEGRECSEGRIGQT